MTNSNLGFLAFHWIQTLPISNPNRDRTGAPKTTYYGGSMRGRISSQSWSRQVREAFNEKWDGDVGNRSRLWADQLAQQLQDKLGYERTDALTVAFLMLSATGAKADKAETFRAGQTDVLMFLSNTELQELVAIARHYQPQLDQVLRELRSSVSDALSQGKAPSFEIGAKKSKGKGKGKSDAEEAKADLSSLKELHERVKNTLMSNRSAADIALFGRFLASLTDANIEGSLSRAHMVTTHAVAVETDFWTAMDDLTKYSGNEEEDEGKAGSGAGHLGDRPQTSGVYACSCAVDLGQLQENLGKDGDFKKVIRTFVTALITASRGKGYIHQFHHRSLPNLFMVELTEACPLNCLAAFEKPIVVDKKAGYLERSIQQLDNWWHDQNKLLEGLVKTQTCAVVEPSLKAQLSHLTSPQLQPSYGDLLETVMAWLED